jgi:enamine deaminase RidA (YjgF/YER057c/UK114 family)
MTPERKLADLGHPLPELPPHGDKPYLPLAQIGRIVYGSGNTSIDRLSGHVYAGRVGAEIDMEEAQAYARVATLNALAALRAHLGTLDRVERVIRLTGYVNSADSFTGQAEVMNAASRLLLAAFGDRGRHARSAIGVAQLPGGAAVEVELIVAVDKASRPDEEGIP